MLNNYQQVFTEIWGASTFKGADKPLSDFVKPKPGLNNHVSCLLNIESICC